MARVNGITQFLHATHTIILTLPRKQSPDGTTRTRRHTSDIAYYSIYRPRKDEMLSWPSRLTYSGRLAHISGHPSAAGRAWDRESSPVKDQRSNYCATQPNKNRTRKASLMPAEFFFNGVKFSQCRELSSDNKTRKSVLLTVRQKCTLAASHAAAWWVTLSMRRALY